MPIIPRILIILSGSLLIGCIREFPVAEDHLLTSPEDHDPDEPDGCAAPPARDLSMGPFRPNPFRESTSVLFELRRAGPVSLVVYDVSGRRLAVLIEGHRIEGPHRATWRGRDAAGREAPAGVYLIRLRAAGVRESRRLARVR